MFNLKIKMNLLIILVLCTIFLAGCAYSWPHMPSPNDIIEQVISGLSDFGNSLQEMFQGFGGSAGF